MSLIDHIRSVFHYDPVSGDLRWKINSKPFLIGKIAGCEKKTGYRYVHIAGKDYKVHRVIWAFVYGFFPSEDVDHINGDKTDNKISNLREATRSQNNANSKLRKDNQYGAKGITWMPTRDKWKARINFNGKTINLGHFDSREEAVLAYEHAAKEKFGSFYREMVLR